MNDFKSQLRVTEIFYSLQGESTKIGLPTVFIRLTGCPLRCHYCDTTYAFKGGTILSINDILHEIKQYTCEHICVTGGEPLAQLGVCNLLQSLCDLGYQVSLETSGAISIAKIDPRVMVIMDLKTPDSGEADKNLLENIKYLKPSDQIKFVLGSKADYHWAAEMLKNLKLNEKAQILFSPSWDKLDNKDLAEWILQDRLPVRMQLQMHKILWDDVRGR